MISFRSITDGDLDAVVELTARVSGQEAYEPLSRLLRDAYERCSYMPKELCWIAEVDGRIAAKWQGLEFEIRIGQSKVRMLGIQGVVSEPDARGRGYAERIPLEAAPAVLARGYEVMLGFAQRGAFYERMGGIPVMADYDLRMNARRIPPLRDDPFVPMENGDVERMLDHYNVGNAARTGTLVRPKDYWEWMVRKAPIYLMSPDGYMGIRLGEGQVELREIAGHSYDFFELALRKLGAMAREAGARLVRGHIPADHPFAEVARTYGGEVRIEYPRRSGCMARILAFPQIMEVLRPELEERLLASSHCDRPVRLKARCDDSGVDLLLNPGAAPERVIEVAMSTQAWSQLVFGYKPVRSLLWEQGHSLDEATCQALDVLFPQAHSFMWHTDRF